MENNNEVFLLYFSTPANSVIYDNLLETIRSNYPSKKIDDNLFLIITKNNRDEVFEKLEKFHPKGWLLLVAIKTFRGRLGREIWEWLDEQKPNFVSFGDDIKK